MINRAWVPVAASALIYVVITAILGRDVLAHLGTTVANDPGDPLLVAAILKWNATHVPLTDGWWQFPIFHPTRDTLAFSEHFLGLSVVAAPIQWMTGDTLVTYNLVMLLTFPLCALAMYALVHRLTGSAAGAFVAGLAYGFAPYRVAQLSHLQMLAAFWAPLALTGLHAYLDTGKRRWLALYGAAWMLQSATNGYSFVFFSALIGFWVLWFVVATRCWRALSMIAAATMLAVLPLVPVLYEYVTVHAYHGFGRTVEEARLFSADLSALLCAPDGLSLWGWVRAGCYPRGVVLREVELFPGVALIGLCGAYLWRGHRLEPARGPTPRRGGLALARRFLLGVTLTYAVALSAVLVLGPWRIEFGPLAVSVSSVRKPLLIGMTTLGLAMLLSPRLHAAVRRSNTTGFYLLAALVTWSLALGPTLTFMGAHTGIDGPFEWLLTLPGVDSFRVPARFWLMTVLCLAVVAGTSVSEMILGRSRAFACGAVLLAAVGVLADGWFDRIPAYPAPSVAPNAALLKGATVIELPPDGHVRDIAATFRAVEGEWTTVNGYSGYVPSYYYALKGAARAEDEHVLVPFQRAGELHVLVPRDAPRLIALVERQPGVTTTARSSSMMQYRLPRRPTVNPPPGLGRRSAVAGLVSACSSHQLPLAIDGNESSVWECLAGTGRRTITIDMGEIGTVGAIVHSVGRRPWSVPGNLRVETSEDAMTWSDAWSGRPLEETMVAGRTNPLELRIAVRFPRRSARYVRLSGEASEPGVPWSIAELEIWSGVAAAP